MKTKAIEFNANALVGSVEAFVHHLTGNQKLTLRKATVPLPPRVESLTPSAFLQVGPRTCQARS
jgi:hypothetical protein